VLIGGLEILLIAGQVGNRVDQRCQMVEQSALRADSENLSPVLRDRLVARLRRTCPV